MDVFIWPRVLVDSIDDLRTRLIEGASQGFTLVLHVSGENTVWDFDIPEGVGVEFVGASEDVILNAQGPYLKNLGRLSFKNIAVSFEEATLSVEAPLIFQHARLIGFERCPPSFEELDGLCVYISEVPDLYKDVADNCQGNVPSNSTCPKRALNLLCSGF